MRTCLSLFLSFLGVAVLPPAMAENLSSTAITYSYGQGFTEPNNARDISKHVVTLSHAHGYSLGNQLLGVTLLKSDENNPQLGSGEGAREIYAIYRHNLSLGKLSGQSFAFGPLRDVALTAGFDWNTKNDAFGARKRAWRVGPTLEFAVPGFLTLGLLYQKEYNHTELPAPRHDVSFEGIPVLAAAWGVPFSLAGKAVRFEGFFEQRAAKGKDYWNRDTAAESHMEAALLFDLSSAAGLGRDKLFIGPAYQDWRNKMGNPPGVGTHTSTPMLRLKWFF